MAEQDDVRDDLDVELFDYIGKTVTIYTQATPTYNARGELEEDDFTDSNIVIVPYNITDKERTSQAFGDLPEGSMMAVLRYDQAVDTKDILLIENENWEVRMIEKNYLPGNVATIVGLVRAHNQETIVVELLGLLDANLDTLLDSNSDTLKVTS